MDDIPLCGCGPCRQNALNSLRGLIRSKETALRQNTAVKDALQAAAMATEDDQFRTDCESKATEMDYAVRGRGTIIQELKSLEAWLAEHFDGLPQEAESALWRLIERNPHVPF